MSYELEAAAIGALVGGAVSYLLKIREETENQKRAFESFQYFHKHWLSNVYGKSQAVQQRDFPLLSKSLEELSATILKQGHSSTINYFLQYAITFRTLAGYVASGLWGLASYSEDELIELMSKARTDIEASGVI